MGSGYRLIEYFISIHSQPEFISLDILLSSTQDFTGLLCSMGLSVEELLSLSVSGIRFFFSLGHGPVLQFKQRGQITSSSEKQS